MPDVAIMMPCFNAEDTLPLALASLQSQTFENWTLYAVDDGSTDSTRELLEAAAQRDPRVTVEAFSENRGRGAARQRSLEKAQGDLLAFLDSDDWYFPDKLERQVAVFTENPDICALGNISAITNANVEIVGVSRLSRPAPEPTNFDVLAQPPFEFPSSMVRMAPAKNTGFDPRFTRSQDSDFMRRLLFGRRYVTLTTTMYGYSQAMSASLQRTLRGYRFRCLGYMKFYRQHPMQVAHRVLETAGKAALYAGASVLGLDERLIENRWREPTEEERMRFAWARSTVEKVLNESRG